MKKKPILIIGGMGPEASTYMHTTLINNSTKHYNAKNNHDFPEIIHYSVPVPDFISSNENKDIAIDILKTKIKELNTLDILCGSIACNTAHVILDELKKESNFPFVSMIDEVVNAVSNDKIETVGLLGTPSTLNSEIYQNSFKNNNINTVLPVKEDYIYIENAIRNVIARESSEEDAENLRRIADDLKLKGAQAIVLGCTELPLIFPKDYTLPVFNSVEILSLSLLHKYYNQ